MTKEQTRDMILCATGKMKCKACSCRSAETVKGVRCGLPIEAKAMIKAKLNKENKRNGKTTFKLKG